MGADPGDPARGSPSCRVGGALRWGNRKRLGAGSWGGRPGPTPSPEIEHRPGREGLFATVPAT